MAEFTLRIDCDNAAFEEGGNAELSRTFSALSDSLKRWPKLEYNESGAIRDTNGNRVGFWTYTP